LWKNVPTARGSGEVEVGIVEPMFADLHRARASPSYTVPDASCMMRRPTSRRTSERDLVDEGVLCELLARAATRAVIKVHDSRRDIRSASTPFTISIALSEVNSPA